MFYRGEKESSCSLSCFIFSYRLGTIIFSIFVCVGQVSANERAKDDTRSISAGSGMEKKARMASLIVACIQGGSGWILCSQQDSA